MTTAATPIRTSLVDVEKKYSKFRETVHRATVMDFRSTDQTPSASTHITGITDYAIATFNQGWDFGRRKVDWDWEAEVAKWRKRRPSYWEMAIWHKQTLCGLVLGGPSRRRTRLYVEGIEGNPGTNPLKSYIILIALLGSERYAELIGCKEVWIVAPAEELIDLYVKAGYTLRPPNKLLAKVLRLKSFAVKAVGV